MYYYDCVDIFIRTSMTQTFSIIFLLGVSTFRCVSKKKMCLYNIIDSIMNE